MSKRIRLTITVDDECSTMQLYLQKFMREHEDWKELLTKDPYNLEIKEDGDYMLFKYNQIASDFNLPEVQEARGIIFRIDNHKCVCHPFNKFGNYGESYCPEIDWTTASVQQKVDGSLMKVWFDEGWHISTNGTIDAFKANLSSDIEFKSYGDLFVNELKHCGAIDSFDKLCNYLDEDYTYMFELVTEYNRVVVPADNYDSSIYYLACRNNITSKEEFIDGSYLSQVLYKPKRYALNSLDSVLKAAKELPWDEEGYVVCDKNFNRVKIKSPEYVRAHYARNNNIVTWERLIQVVLDGEIEEFCIYASEYEDKVRMIDKQIKLFKDRVAGDIIMLAPESFATRKDLAMEIKTYPRYEQPFLFKYDQLDKAFNQVTASRWEEILRELGCIAS